MTIPLDSDDVGIRMRRVAAAIAAETAKLPDRADRGPDGYRVRRPAADDDTVEVEADTDGDQPDDEEEEKPAVARPRPDRSQGSSASRPPYREPTTDDRTKAVILAARQGISVEVALDRLGFRQY